MKVIALRGDQNTGKSHTINAVYTLLLNQGYKPVPGSFRTLNHKFFDAFDILEKNGLKVGIIGMGDYVRKAGSSVKDLLAQQFQNGCHVVICTCRPNKSMENSIRAYQPHHFVDKTRSLGDWNHRMVNLADANSLISLI
ncbi:MAG: hypothetical protein JJ978_04545 [Roseivirga sp.]|jgi:hypothetical protein|uniref:hypothetical protein n=1 Tax=Roseivirga sp. TaxID=1964215 RepID=UPI001B1F64E9|nr:hypothetical protein [Roseivirga sp.]MBO6494815.1 hypothetical protein [Roseivirga sp.]